MPRRDASLRSLPAVERILREPELAEALARLPRRLVVEPVRAEVARERARLQKWQFNRSFHCLMLVMLMVQIVLY